MGDMQKSQLDADSGYIATRGVMEYLGISRRTVERYIADGKLNPVYLPSGRRRFKTSDISTLLTAAAPEAGDAA